MMFGQQPYVYQQPIYNQPIGQPISQPMQEPMMRPQYQPAPQMPAYQPQPQQPQNQPTMTIYDLVERAQTVITPTAARKGMMEEYVTRKEFDELVAKLATQSVRPRKMKEADNESTV